MLVKGWFTSPVRVGDSRFNAIFVVLALSLAGGACWLAFEHWGWLQGGAGDPESNSTTLRNVALIIGGGVALVLALWRGIVAGHQADAAQQQVELGQQGLLNERYQKGAEMLGDSVLSVRMGGIYALRRLAEERPEQYYLQIMDLLCAFVRHPTEDKNVGQGLPRLREDVQAIVEIIRKRSENLIALEKANDFRLDLGNADLRYADIRLADLSGADLRGADIRDAYLPQVNLSGANLTQAKLSGSELMPDVNLSRAILQSADLSRTILYGVNFSEAHLNEANLQYSQLNEAILREAKLRGSDLVHTDLNRADLSDSFMSDAKLASASLKDTNFNRAYIAGVEFYDTHQCHDMDECCNAHKCYNADEFSNPGGCDDTYQCQMSHMKADNKKPARELTQEQLDEADVEPGDVHPRLDGFVMDVETGKPLEWNP